MRFDPISLRLFIAIAQTGSISGASKRVNIALAAASRRIVQLEADVGAELLNRRARGVTLTGPGMALLRHAQDVEDAFVRMRTDMAEYASGLKGTIRIAANSSSVLQFLPRDLERFLATHEGLRIDMAEHASAEVLRAVKEGVAEIGVFHTDGLEPGDDLAVLPYRRDELVLLVPTSFALKRRREVHLEEFLDHSFVALAPGTSLRTAIVSAAHAAGKTLRVRIQVRGFETMVRMVAAGMGVAVVPSGAMHPSGNQGVQVLALKDAWAQRQHAIVHRPVGTLARPASLLAAFLARCADR